MLNKTDDVLHPPDDKELRLMRHHAHCKEYHGKIGVLCEESYESLAKIGIIQERSLNSKQLVELNTKAMLGNFGIDHQFTKEQLDMLAYTYPYHMYNEMSEQTLDIHNRILQKKIDHIQRCINRFNVRHPLLQLRFNLHDHYHRSSCFKKGPECRASLPQPHSSIAYIYFDNDKTTNWHFIDGTIKK